jgi:hypothetical protein
MLESTDCDGIYRLFVEHQAADAKVRAHPLRNTHFKTCFQINEKEEHMIHNVGESQPLPQF